MAVDEAVASSLYCWDCRLLARVWVKDGDCLVFVGKVVYDRLCDNIEWPTQENIIGRSTEDVDLQIERDIPH